MSDTERKAIKEHIEECQKRLITIKRFMETNTDRDKAECMRNIARLEVVASALQELEQYSQIGTLDECRKMQEMRNKKKVLYVKRPKAPVDIEAYGEDALFGYCPNCRKQASDFWNNRCCGDCGQALDWEEA